MGPVVVLLAACGAFALGLQGDGAAGRAAAAPGFAHAPAPASPGAAGGGAGPLFGGVGDGAGPVLWQYGFESGSVAPFQVWKNGRSEVRVVGEPRRSGDNAAALTITPSRSRGPGLRLAVPYLQDGSKLPDRAYYSAWYFLPTRVTTPWDNIFQFKQHDPRVDTSHPVWTLTIRNRPGTDAMYLAATDHVGNDGTYRGRGWGMRASAPEGVDLPVGRWFQLECLYDWSMTDGRIACWQDGVLLWDLRGEQTEYDFDPPRSRADGDLSRQWTVNNYSDETEPSPFTLFVDDAAISTERLGPGTRSAQGR